MKSTIKTLILATAGAALLVASPAFAKTRHTAGVQYTAPVAEQGYQEQQAAQDGVVAPIPGDTFGQIRGEYLKDGPSHNGSGY
jgi:hypothetical protein